MGAFATFRYRDAVLSWEPEHGYRQLETGEWVLSPAEAVGGYVEGDPQGREDYQELAHRVQTFWLGHLGGSGGEIEEVRFEN